MDDQNTYIDSASSAQKHRSPRSRLPRPACCCLNSRPRRQNVPKRFGWRQIQQDRQPTQRRVHSFVQHQHHTSPLQQRMMRVTCTDSRSGKPAREEKQQRARYLYDDLQRSLLRLPRPPFQHPATSASSFLHAYPSTRLSSLFYVYMF